MMKSGGTILDFFHVNILQLIWPIIDTDTYVYFFPTPNCRDQVSFVVEFTYSSIMHALTVLPHQQMQA